MTAVRSGAVTFTAVSVRGPYQQYQGDLFRCHVCGAEVVTNYGSGPTWEHFQGTKPEISIAVAYEEEQGRPQGAPAALVTDDISVSGR